jgi:hypothetical protein
MIKPRTITKRFPALLGAAALLSVSLLSVGASVVLAPGHATAGSIISECGQPGGNNCDP